MKQPLRWLGYLFLGCVCFGFFLYWTFPYHLVKERLTSAIEQQLGNAVSVTIDQLGPSWVTGVKIHGLKMEARTGEGLVPLWQADRVKIRVGLFSLLFGTPRVGFSVKSRASAFSGSVRRMENGFQLELDVDPIDLGDVGFFKTKLGMQMGGTIEGACRLQMNTAQLAQSQGQLQLVFKDWKIKKGSKISMGAMGETELKEDLLLSKGNDFGLKVTVAKGAAEVGELKLAGGDLDVDLKGQAFLSPKFANIRMNIAGQFKTSPKVDQLLPFLFLLEKQKQADGTYPVTISGNINKPQIKIGEFPLSF